MSKPAQMYDHELNAVKGWPSPYAVDKCLDLVGDKTCYRGMVMSINNNDKFVVGLYCGAMPIFALETSTDFDVVGDDGNLVGGANGTPHMSGLVAVSGLEVESTEYDKAENYPPNTKLTAGEPGAVDAGVIKPGVPYADTICGVVSDGVQSNEFKKNWLRFWPVWLPPLECPERSSEVAPNVFVPQT